MIVMWLACARAPVVGPQPADGPAQLQIQPIVRPTGIAAAPDGRWVVVAHTGGLSVLDGATLAPLRAIQPHGGPFLDVSLAEDRSVHAMDGDWSSWSVDPVTGASRPLGDAPRDGLRSGREPRHEAGVPWSLPLPDGRAVTVTEEGEVSIGDAHARLPAGHRPTRATTAGERVWMTTPEGDVLRIEPGSDPVSSPGIGAGGVVRAGFVDDERIYVVTEDQELLVLAPREVPRVLSAGTWVDAIPWDGGLLAVDARGAASFVDPKDGATRPAWCLLDACFGPAPFPAPPKSEAAVDGHRTALARWWLGREPPKVTVRLGDAGGHLVTAEMEEDLYGDPTSLFTRRVSVWDDGVRTAEWTSGACVPVWMDNTRVVVGDGIVLSLPGLEPLPTAPAAADGTPGWAPLVTGSALAVAITPRLGGDEDEPWPDVVRVGHTGPEGFVADPSWPFDWWPPNLVDTGAAVRGDRFLVYGGLDARAASPLRVYRFVPDGVVRSTHPGIVGAPRPSERWFPPLNPPRDPECRQDRPTFGLASGLPTPADLAALVTGPGPVLITRGERGPLPTVPWPVVAAPEVSRRPGWIPNLVLADPQTVWWSGYVQQLTAELVAELAGGTGTWTPGDTSWETLLASERRAQLAAEERARAGDEMRALEAHVDAGEWDLARVIADRLVAAAEPNDDAKRWHRSLSWVGRTLPMDTLGTADRVLVVDLRVGRAPDPKLVSELEGDGITVVRIDRLSGKGAVRVPLDWEGIDGQGKEMLLVEDGVVVWVGDPARLRALLDRP